MLVTLNDLPKGLGLLFNHTDEVSIVMVSEVSELIVPGRLPLSADLTQSAFDGDGIFGGPKHMQ